MSTYKIVRGKKNIINFLARDKWNAISKATHYFDRFKLFDSNNVLIFVK